MIVKILKLIVFAFFLAFFGISSAFAATSIPFTVNMSEAVNVTGTPRIAVDVGGVTRYATYTSGTGSSALTFTYTMVAGDVDLDGVTLTSPIDLNGGTMKDLRGNDLSPLTYTLPNTSNVKVNYPSLGMDFIYDADGRYTLNGTVYNDLTSFLSAAGGTFTRASTATYYDSTGTLQTAASGTPRFDYDPVTFQSRGLLIEDQRTNYITNSSMIGAIVGTPGTLPTGWAFGSKLGLSTSVVGTGTANGVSYIDIRVFGTTTSAGNVDLTFISGTSTPASSGQSWTQSAYISKIAGTFPSNIYLTLWEANASGNWLAGYLKSISSAGSTLAIYSISGTFSNASTVNARGLIELLSVVSGTSLDFTIRIAAPQLELGSSATSFIPTTNATVTRGADILEMPTGTWFNSTAGTLSVDAFNGEKSSTVGIVAIDGIAGRSTNRITLIRVSPTNIEAMVNVGGAVQYQTALAGNGNYALNKVGMGYQANNFRQAMNNNLGGVDTSGILPTLDTLRLGSWSGSANIYNGWIQKFKYYPLRTSDTQLKLLTQ